MVQVWSTEQVAGPLFQALQPALAGAAWSSGRWPSHADYQALLDRSLPLVRTASGAPLKVVAQAAVPDQWQEGYEPRIYLSGELQTRGENWHDLFNLLVWASFPRAKAALNRRHFGLQQAREAQGALKQPRSATQDVLTQFDETGVIVACAGPELAELLREFRWKELFWQRREELAANMACYLFGHGLMEKSLTPYRGMTGKGVILPVAPSFFSLTLAERVALLDEALAKRVDALQKPADLAPVPVLGFPGFTPENEIEAYYDDQDYFRPGRRAGSAAK